MTTTNRSGLFAGVSALLIPAAIGMVFFYAPLEKTMGSVQKIFYFHLPLAFSAFLSFFVAFIAGIMYLRTRRLIWDARLAASVEIGVVLTTLVPWPKVMLELRFQKMSMFFHQPVMPFWKLPS